MLEEKDVKILTKSFVEALKEVKESLTKPSGEYSPDLQARQFTATPSNMVYAKANFLIPPERMEYTSEPNSDLKETHISQVQTTSMLPIPIGLSGISLNEDGSVTFKFKKKTSFPISYMLTFVK